MKVAVKDANIFIDLEAMGLLDLWFQLGHETLTSDYVVIELEDGGHSTALACIKAGLVRVAVIGADEWADFEALRLDCEPKGMSVEDVSVLFLARREDAMLLSGDRILRRDAQARSVEVHGTIWILEQMVERGLLGHGLAADRLEALIQATGEQRRFLPVAECEARILKWRKTGR